ncbi:MAG: O-antigen ligase family protein [Aquabacterium sp.]|nr:O-antigen ligase family protein [Aquabacterium sp.]
MQNTTKNYQHTATLLYFLIPIICHLPQIAGEGASRIAITLIILALTTPFLILKSAGSIQQTKLISRIFGDIATLKGNNTKYTLIYIAACISAEMRGIYSEQSKPFSFVGLFALLSICYVVGYICFAMTSTERQRLRLVQAFSAGACTYILLNIAGWALGVHGNTWQDAVMNAGDNSILASIGISAPRVAFPFAAGLNHFSIFSGIATVIALQTIMITISNWGKFIIAIEIAIGTTGLILSDSRGAIIMTVIAIALSALVKRKFIAKKTFISLFFASSLLPFAAPPVIDFLNSTSLITSLSRDGAASRNLGVASGRDVIWSEGVKGVFSKPESALIGFGTYGQVTSGAERNYSWIFGSTPGTGQATVHNAPLQILLDMGLIGLISWFFLWKEIGTGIDTVSKFGSYSTQCMILSCGIFLYLMSFTEVSCTPYIIDSLMLLLLLSGSLQGFLRQADKTTNTIKINE